jgi:chemotaxis protein CheX
VTDPLTHDASTRLPQVLDLAQAKQLRDDLAGLLARGAAQGAAELDAGDVERMSTPAAQLLLAAGRAADAAGVGFKIVNTSDAFRNGLLDLGLHNEFKHWMS